MCNSSTKHIAYNIWFDMPVMRLAFDTDVIVASRRSRGGASHGLLRALQAGKLTGVASVSMMLEYEAILMRPEQRFAAGMDMSGRPGFP